MMKQKKGVLFAVFEAAPFIKTGGLGDVGGSLPIALKEAGCDVWVLLPKLWCIPREYLDRMEHVADFQVTLGWRSLFCGVEKLEHRGVTFYFIDNEYYFRRDRPYGYFDDGERMAFFSKAVVESVRYIPGFQCGILHCNDWHTALVPVFLRELYRGTPDFDCIKTVFTVHNVKFQGQFSDKLTSEILGLGGIPAAETQLRCDKDSINYMKGGLLYSDILTAVSPSYAEELKHPFYGEGLDAVFRQREGALRGILNGIDTNEYDPYSDRHIPENFSSGDIFGKAACKAALQKELDLERNPGAPLACMVGRLTEQKGLELLIRVLEEILENGLQLAVLGTGDGRYEEALRRLSEKHPGKMSVRLRFDAELSNRMYAGADILLMPSLFEPCGLSQMIAMRYGTLPVVRETGGLRDSVTPYNKYTGEGNGFSFRNYNAHEMMHTLLTAAEIYRNDKVAWRRLIRNAMSSDFGWQRAAEEYMDIYRGLHPEET